MHGVDKIKPEPLPPTGSVNGKILTTLQIRTRSARRALASRGMLEAVTWSFISAEHAKLFGGGSEKLKLVNPIAADMSDMRPSLLPGLLTAAQRNADRGFGDVAIFEVSGTYEGDTPDTQRRVAGGVRRGTASIAGAGRMWSNGAKGGGKPVDVFDAKADALAVLEACGIPMSNVQIEQGGPEWYHPAVPARSRPAPRSFSAPSVNSIRRHWKRSTFPARCVASKSISMPCRSRRRRRPAPSRRWSFRPSRW